MIHFVFYKPDAFSSLASIRVNRGSAEAAEAFAQHELEDMTGARVYYTLPGGAVCPRCWHPWDLHGAHGCSYQHAVACEDGLHEWRCHCKRRSPCIAS